MVSCSLRAAQPPVDLVTRAREESIFCTNCQTPFAPKRYYRIGAFEVAVAANERNEKTRVNSGERRRRLEEMRIEVTQGQTLRIVARCVDEYSYTQPSSSSFALEIEDSFRCSSEDGSPSPFSLNIVTKESDRYEGELTSSAGSLALGSMRETLNDVPGRVRGFTLARGATTLAAWRSQRGSGPELVWIGHDPAPSDEELGFFLLTLFFQPGNMPL